MSRGYNGKPGIGDHEKIYFIVPKGLEEFAIKFGMQHDEKEGWYSWYDHKCVMLMMQFFREREEDVSASEGNINTPE